MTLARLHRRLVIAMGLAALLAFAGGAGFEPVSAFLAFVALVTAFFWQPSPGTAKILERAWLPVALLLVIRALAHVFVLGGDVVIPVVDLLLLLLCAEAFRSLEASNDARLYALTFALLLASTAYRPGLLFAIAFVVYLATGTVALTVGHLRRKSAQHRTPPPTLNRGFLLRTGALSGVVLLVSAVVFLTFPRVSRAWSGRGETMATSIVGFSDEVSLAQHGARIYPNPEIVLRVEFPDGPPGNPAALHWRGRSYDDFDGQRWSRSRGIRTSLGPTDWYRSWGDSLVRQKIYAAPLDVRVLFALHPALEIEGDPGIHPLFDKVGDYTYWGRGTPVYEAVSVGSRPSPEALREAEDGYMPDRNRYLQLPDLEPRVHRLADSLTAGLTTRYDRARAIEEWLETAFDYTLELPADPRRATLEHFLFERRAGHCEYFSTAMVVLLRSQGIHARNVNGFLGGRWSEFGQYLAVSQNEAHSWVEVWFPGYGWVPFDPTPAGTGAARSARIWDWPGRFLFDALQHRWSKWVLDYDIGSQSDLLQNLFGGPEAAVAGDGTGEETGMGWLWILGGIALAGTTVVLVLRARSDLPPETRLYLDLVAESRRAGVVGGGPVTPLALVGRLEETGHPAAAHAAEVVDSYVRSRFGGVVLGREARDAMVEALGHARRLLRGRERNGPRTRRRRRG